MDYEELVALYMDANNILNKNKLKDNIVVAIIEYIIEYILTNIWYITYNDNKINTNKYLVNRFAGLVILQNDIVLLNEINEVFKTKYVIPKIEQENKPSDLYKTLALKVLSEDVVGSFQM